MEANKRISKIRANLFIDFPFYGSLILYLNPIQKEEAETACVSLDGDLFYSEKFIQELSDEKLRFILLHELLHLVFLHLVRQKEDPTIWNYATDLVINSILEKDGFVKRDSRFFFPNREDDLVLEDKVLKDVYKRTAEQVYNFLVQNSYRIEMKELGNGEVEYRVFKGDKEVGRFRGQALPHKYFGEKGKGDKDNEKEDKWKLIIIKEMTRAKLQGNLPGTFEEYLNELVRPPKIDWRQYLERVVEKEFPFDYTYSKPSKRSYYMEPQVVIPSIGSEGFNRLVIGIDTSGSMGTEQLTEIISEIRSVLDLYPYLRMTMVQCDAEIQKVIEVRGLFDLDEIRKIRGRGGTDFRPFFDYVSKNFPDTKVVFYFTDTWGEFPSKAPDYRVIWVVLGENEKVPFGEVVKMQ